MQFLPPSPAVKLVDLAGESGLWGIKVIDPKGERTRVRATVTQAWYESKQRDGFTAKMRQSGNLRTHLVSAAHPYRRSLDLGKLYDFKQPGNYRVQLLYDNHGTAKRELGEWPGMFTGREFSVTVTAPKAAGSSPPSE